MNATILAFIGYGRGSYPAHATWQDHGTRTVDLTDEGLLVYPCAGVPMAFVSTGAIQLYYEVHGPDPGTAPAVVFAHGAGGNHLSWWQQVPHFSRHYTCITFDHRGFGQSAEPDNGPGGAAFIEDLRTLLDHLHIERATLVAQSMGGWTCLGFTLRYPQRVDKLVMCDTHGGLTSDEIAQLWSTAWQAAAAVPAGVHPAAGARMAREQPALHFLYNQLNALNPARSLDGLGTLLSAVGAPTASDVGALDVPVLFLAGEEDIVIPPRILEMVAGWFPQARFEAVPAAGHSVYFERPEQFNAIVERFIGHR
jgi:pimeloyl-ACP methyl ester carboxylesterase